MNQTIHHDPTEVFSDPAGYLSLYYFPPDVTSEIDPGARAKSFNLPYKYL